MTKVVVGPMLRYLDADSATIWAEVDAACTVSVTAGELTADARTFCVGGHHYAIVALRGLTPGSAVEYSVELDGTQVWPVDDGWPASVIRPPAPGAPLHTMFGSCRAAAPLDDDEWGTDALHALAERMRTSDRQTWPDLLALVGDQVYADDNLSPETKKYIAAQRGPDEGAGHEVANFDEYTFLYAESWAPLPIRWLFSTLPSAMIFDDHDIRDDWNTSEPWRRQMQATNWWQERITGGLVTYWIYQHLGNLSPDELDADPLLAQLLSQEEDGYPLLREHAERADAAADGGPGAHWSYCRDYGRVRLVVLDSRCNRVVDGKQRLMVGDAEWKWFAEQCGAGPRPGADPLEHLLIVTSLPYLLPPGVHGVEAFDESVAEGRWGPRFARWGEKARQGADLEHWAAFETSFRRMRDVIKKVSEGDQPPASITFLSGDVHFSYLAEAQLKGICAERTRVLQAVCSPIRNPLNATMRVAERVAVSAFGRMLGRALTSGAHAATPGLTWQVTSGPAFGNTLGELRLDGRDWQLSVSSAQPGPTLSQSWAAAFPASANGSPTA